MSVKGAAVLFIEQELFILNSKISSEKQLVGQSQDCSPFTVDAQNQCKNTRTLAVAASTIAPAFVCLFFF